MKIGRDIPAELFPDFETGDWLIETPDDPDAPIAWCPAAEFDTYFEELS